MKGETSSYGWTIELLNKPRESTPSTPLYCSTVEGLSPLKCKPQRYFYYLGSIYVNESEGHFREENKTMGSRGYKNGV